MPSLKSLRLRINSVKSTQKITSAMKMVAAAKLRRAQSQAEASRPYAKRMGQMMSAIAAGAATNPNAPPLLVGTGRDKTHLLVAVTADRGLAGAFNSNISRAVRNKVRELEAQGKTVKVFAVGRKGNDYFRREIAGQIVGTKNFVGKKTIEFADAEAISESIVAMFREGQFDVCTLVFNRFISVMTQTVTESPLIPAATPVANDNAAAVDYEIEPDDGTLLDRLLPRNLAVQIYSALLENSAGFYASQMTAMDNATRNAGEMIKKLSLNYNRARQANITSELIEIISGAEAV
ncbi:MAG: F0F1 ATP synthase subunit gamma [Acidocella sp. 20-57-95]|nr:MAG: F0F1 ATP synthase subunit gamma [Acidocella sp. 20-57-95]OYV57806.1 MAG: F0F1 ATP synthase subunit gamma [Acidocella sp. 21-58-7]HQT65220.1 F0F1 ATP synthase subunit gamma [Acidocella sp.]HQU05465.1 F0F1 ATP synthase subunit gamma [Acidocella sp.]